jgi:diguanylate cyclase (GGDEF)-like protein
MVVVFSAPVARVLDSIRAIDDTHDLELLPGLAILAFVFMLHQLWKRQELRAQTLAAGAAARDATERAAEMGRLVAFSQDLARSLEPEAIRAAALTHLPLLVPDRRVWVSFRDGSRPLAVGIDAPGATAATPASDVWYPMMVAEEELGTLAVSGSPPLPLHQISIVATAAALLAVSLKNAALLEAVRESSVRDALTGCFNRTHALEVLDSELRRMGRAGGSLSVVMFDLDRFKAINDTYGHLCGDAMLAAVGGRMRAVLRGADLKCRYGGEEFLIVLPDTPLAGAVHVAASLRRDLQDHGFRWHDDTLKVTASFGVTTASPDDTDPLVLIARADEALYRAKQEGRNRVCVAGSSPSALTCEESEGHAVVANRPRPADAS